MAARQISIVHGQGNSAGQILHGADTWGDDHAPLELL